MTKESVIRLCVVVGFIALVEGLCRTGVIGATVMTAPSQMASQLLRVLAAGTYNHDIAFSFINIVCAAVLAVVAGFGLGVVIHSLPRLRQALEPLLSSYYAVPTFIFYPVFIVLFGVGHGSIIAIAVLLAIVAMITATLSGLDRIPAVLRKTARVMRLSRARTALAIELPAALPHLFGGVKLAVAYAFIGVIASEFILSGAGMGYAIAYAYNQFDNANMYALMLLVLLSVTLVNGLLNHIDRRLQRRQQR
ncbi:ABC transporter permease [Pseudomonas typographi]|uniref:ABC transporter permease subunit n=1 Tax=Pseudomonas typographi TaxID=2715964 RepID=A0ABR7ZA50_9PSED|nr:ABC transporter permease subunit [Pseudomonas typographi]MBD1552431.1 ABC transporter permease subunit [Pseudomonas typographi]MBD1587174.1 ABC transporter permease subunit [Pseudomonas typographi]MBD1602297.1 ABC transporter permease subunit [Pseudomonas typographi]